MRISSTAIYFAALLTAPCLVAQSFYGTLRGSRTGARVLCRSAVTDGWRGKLSGMIPIWTGVRHCPGRIESSAHGVAAVPAVPELSGRLILGLLTDAT